MKIPLATMPGLLPFDREISILLEDLDRWCRGRRRRDVLWNRKPSEWASQIAGTLPFSSPHVLMNSHLLRLHDRAFESPPVRRHKMSPVEAGNGGRRLTCVWAIAGEPACQAAIKTFPSGLNLKTCWPFPSFPWESVAHKFTVLSTKDCP